MLQLLFVINLCEVELSPSGGSVLPVSAEMVAAAPTLPSHRQ